jgi:signal transduction histidine kinase
VIVRRTEDVIVRRTEGTVRLRYDWSVRTRMALLSSVVIALLCVGFCELLLRGTHGYAMRNRADQIALAELKVSRLIAGNRLRPLLHDQTISALQVVDGKGRIAATNRPVNGDPRIAFLVPAKEGAPTERVTCSVPGFPHECMILVAMRVAERDTEWIVYGADPVIPWYVGRKLLTELLSSSALLVVAAAVGAHRTVAKALAPVDDVVRELTEITATDLGRRVPVSEHHDEMRGLAETVNQTLDRLEAAVERQRRFASDASHDLRSPITAMRLQLDEAQLHPEETDWPKTAVALEAGLDRLEAIVTDLLALARLDSGVTCAQERLDLSELVSAELRNRMSQVRIITGIQPGVVIDGDRLQLIRLLTNLVDNAERHATYTVTISVRRESDEVVLEVADDGPGIPPDQREAVFDRFTRLDNARNNDSGGTGLGLSIAREIAGQHGGTLTIEDSVRGARFVLRMPFRQG